MAPPRNSSSYVKRVDPEVPGVIVNATGGAAPAYATNWSSVTSRQGVTLTRLGPFVIVSGMLKKSAAGVVDETVFTLPAGYLPSAATEIGGFTAADTVSRFAVATTGAVTWKSGDPTTSIVLLGVFRAAYP